MMKRAFTLIFVLVYLFIQPLFAQEAILKGLLVANSGGQPLADISISIPRLKISTITDKIGVFYFNGLYQGQFTLIITDGYDYIDSVKVNIDTAFVDLGIVKINHIPSNVPSIFTQIPEYRLSENDASLFENGTEGQSISGLLNASNDPYLSAAAFNFGNFRYQVRGYNRDQLTVYLNGLQMNDIETGIAFWEQWGGLNDMFRNQNTEFGLQAAEVGVGGLAGITSFEATAAAQSKQMRFSYAFTNRSYRNRAMLSYASGVTRLSQKGSLFFD